MGWEWGDHVRGVSCAWGRFVAAGVVGALMWGALPFQASADPVSSLPEATRSLEQAQGSGQRVEVTSLRSESSETYATPDGNMETDQHLRPSSALGRSRHETGPGTVAPCCARHPARRFR